jgi:hypothetical protein
MTLSTRSLSLAFMALSLSVLCAAPPSVRIERSGDSWSIDTGVIRKVMRIRDGKFSLVSFRNLRSGREYVSPSQISPEVQVSVDGKTITGADGGWTLAGADIREVTPGQAQLDVKIRRESIELTKHYLAYQGTPIIREWVTIANVGSESVKIEEPHFLSCNLLPEETADIDLYYVTGGGNYNGSQLLKMERMSPEYSRVIDSKIGIQTQSYSAYLPLLVLRNRKTKDGVMAGWDYLGHWALHAGKDRKTLERGDLSLKVAGYSKILPPGERIDTPKAFVGAFAGDIDSLGNTLLDWQYEHMWEYTNDAYFARTRWAVDWPGPWVGDGGKPSGDNWGRRLALDLRYVDLMRETGTDILWDDAGWYVKWGSWQGPEWRLTNEFVKKHGMRWALWMPTYLATTGSRIGQQHPEWLTPDGEQFEQSIRATAEWESELLTRSVKEWGGFQWRYDGAPGYSANDTDYLQSDQNIRWLLEKFKSAHKDSGIDACSGGGRWISYDIARFAESGEYTDGGVGPYSSHYTSLIIPPDKYHNVVDFDHTYYRPASDRIHLTMNPTWYRDPGDGPDLEAIRQDWDIYRYLRAQGVAGRWSHIFRPEVSNDDSIYYLQRMNRDGSKGVIITKHAHTAPVYFLVAKRIGGGAQDIYLGGTWNMCTLATENAATIDTGIYEDPIDGEYRYYGATGEVYGPINFKFQRAGTEASYVKEIVKRGAVEPVSNRLFGMAIQPSSEPLVITQLGLGGTGRNAWDLAASKGRYRISILRADSRKEVASAEIDMAKGNADRLGFKYVKLDTPVRLDPGPGNPVIIRPRGLNSTADYDVRCAKSDYRAVRQGADLMDQGIELATVQPGELVFLNLPKHPGARTDTMAPPAPGAVAKRIGTNLGIQGVEVRWSPASDDNWISYYEILRDGEVAARAAIGTFYFDHTGDPDKRIHSTYAVRAVDGDGNRSTVATAALTAGEPPSFRALGGFSPTQGERQWRYEESFEEGKFREMRWEHLGYEGRWTGSGLARIGRIWMQAGAGSDAARVFVVPRKGVASIDGFVQKDPSAENGIAAAVKVLHNGRQIWPASGWMEVQPDSSRRVECRIRSLPVDAGDRIRFVARRTGDHAPQPIVWDPAIVLTLGN